MPLTQVTTGMIADAAVTPAKLANGGVELGTRNKIINGAMMIDQRNAGASFTPASGDYIVDRWLVAISQTSKFTAQQNAGSVTTKAGFPNYLGITSSSSYSVLSSDFFVLQQKVEGFNTADFAWGTADAATVTLSFWVRSSLTGTFGGSVSNSAINRSYPFTYTISVANTWEQKSVTIPGDTTGTWLGATNGIGMRVFFGFGVGSTYSGTAGAWAGADYRSATGATSVVGTSGATFYITGVQLEKGSTATSFDYRPYGTELALCQRYYFSTFASDGAVPTYNSCGSIVSGNQSEALGGRTICTMRATPTYTIWNAATGASGTARFSGSNIGVSSVNGSTVNGFQSMSLSSSASTLGVGSYAFTASAEL